MENHIFHSMIYYCKYTNARDPVNYNFFFFSVYIYIYMKDNFSGTGHFGKRRREIGQHVRRVSGGRHNSGIVFVRRRVEKTDE